MQDGPSRINDLPRKRCPVPSFGGPRQGFSHLPEMSKAYFHDRPPFLRASNARKLEEVGSGLSLAIVKQTAEWHGGAVHLASTEGRGTLVTVDLPRDGARRPPLSGSVL